LEFSTLKHPGNLIFEMGRTSLMPCIVPSKVRKERRNLQPMVGPQPIAFYRKKDLNFPDRPGAFMNFQISLLALTHKKVHWPISRRVLREATTMALFQLIYMSALVTPDLGAVKDILDVSVKNNKRRDITGMMLYSDGDIVQVLEGEKSAVLDTFSKILLDQRHVGIQLLLEQEAADRDFGAWSMGYRHIKKADLEKWPEHVDFFKARDKDLAVRVRKGDALAVLRSFAQ
jgi:hypothetical protein